MTKSGRGKPPLVAPKREMAEAPARRRASGAKKPTGSGSGAKGKAPRRKARRKHGVVVSLILWIWRSFWRALWWATWRVTGLAVIAMSIWVGYYYVQLPPAVEQVDGRVRGSVTMLDRNGDVFAWRGEQFGGLIRTDNVSPDLKNAVVATEDKRFYRHFGISPRGIASAIRINLSEGRGPFQGHGGSTITQQVAKIICLGENYDPSSGLTEAEFEADCRRSTITRKLTEVPFALAMELKYSKDEILMIYLNRAYLGAGAQGFEAASQRYFGKSAGALNASEAAMLAGLLVAPSYYAPTRDLARARERANVILGLMADQGYLTPAELADAKKHPAALSEAAAARAGGYFADWIMETGPSFLTKATTEDVVIRTTYDQRIQTAAEEAMDLVFETKVKKGSEAQAAIVVMSADGAVRAMVGGRTTKAADGQFNRATMAFRQTGSTFKPFVYAAALDLGYRYDSIITDEPITIDVPGSGPWSPKNYSNDYKGPITLTQALSYSINTVAVKLAQDVGLEAVRQVAQDFGIASDLAAGPALALGASEATLIEMTGAYAGILNGGSSVTPYGLVELKLQGDDEPLMGMDGGIGERVITERAARQLVYMMNQASVIGTAQRARLPGREIAAKTGTTQGARDAWFIGFSADYVVGVWMGYDDNSKLTGVTGSGLPAEIWREAMVRIEDGRPAHPLPMIDPTVEALPPATRGERPPVVHEDPAQTILDDLLGAIFGRRN
jgi:penicillin-binding protein 1A